MASTASSSRGARYCSTVPLAASNRARTRGARSERMRSVGGDGAVRAAVGAGAIVGLRWSGRGDRATRLGTAERQRSVHGRARGGDSSTGASDDRGRHVRPCKARKRSVVGRAAVKRACAGRRSSRCNDLMPEKPRPSSRAGAAPHRVRAGSRRGVGREGRTGRSDTIRGDGINQGCTATDARLPVSCVQNPSVGREDAMVDPSRVRRRRVRRRRRTRGARGRWVAAARGTTSCPREPAQLGGKIALAAALRVSGARG